MKKKGKFNFTFVKHLIRAFIVIIAATILLTTVQKAYFTKPEGIRIIQQDEQIASSSYIISEKLIMDKLQQKSQLVSLQQNLNKESTMVDDGLLGKRHTKLSINGVYKLGIETKDIIVKHIDQENSIVYISLPKPVLISLEIPFDKVTFDKSKGFLRLAANEEEEKQYYKAIDKSIRKEIMEDKELMRQAEVFNKDAVMQIFNMMPEINKVIFE